MARRRTSIGAAIAVALLAGAARAGAETLVGAGAAFSNRSNVPGPVGGELFGGWNAAFQGFGVQSWYVYMPEDAALHTIAVQGAMLSPTRGFGIRLRFTVAGGAAASWSSTGDASTRVQPVASLGALVKTSEHTSIGVRSNFFLRPGSTDDAAPSPRWNASIGLLWRP